MAGSLLGDALRAAALAADRQFQATAAATNTLVASAVNLAASQGVRGDGTVGPVQPPPTPVATAAATNAATLAAAIAASTVNLAADPPAAAVQTLFDFATISSVTVHPGPLSVEVDIDGHNFTPGSRAQFFNPAGTTSDFGTTIGIRPDGAVLSSRYDFKEQEGSWQVRIVSATGTPSAFFLFTFTKTTGPVVHVDLSPSGQSGAVVLTALDAGPPPFEASILTGGNAEQCVLTGTGFTLTSDIVVTHPDASVEHILPTTCTEGGTKIMFYFMAHGLAGTHSLVVDDSGRISFTVNP